MKVLPMARCALLTSLLCVSAWISFPVGDIAITLQTFTLFLTLGLLGGKYGTLVCLLYLLTGAIGLPVFSGFMGGLGTLLGATGGYLFGFLAASLVYWLITGCFGTRLCVRLTGLVLGLTACYTFGTVWFLTAYLSSPIGLWAVLLKCVVPYIIPDLLKLGAALLLTEKLKGLLKL